jgi:hypothetical protein
MQANTEVFKLAAAPGNGDAMPVDRYTFKSVHIRPGGAAPDYDLEMTFDGDNWVKHTSNIATDTVITTEDVTNPLPRAIKALRIVTTTAGSGAPSAVMFGHDPV